MEIIQASCQRVQIIGADTLVIFSDVDGLYDKSKNIVKTVNKIDEKVYSLVDKVKMYMDQVEFQQNQMQQEYV